MAATWLSDLHLCGSMASQFDEALPFYAWQEDIDFSRQLASFGRIVRADALTGVHLGVKRGRTSGVRFGYSQIANPIYFIRKGTVSLSFGGRTMTKNLLANVIRTLHPEAHIDRRGRLKGNILAFLRPNARAAPSGTHPGDRLSQVTQAIMTDASLRFSSTP